MEGMKSADSGLACPKIPFIQKVKEIMHPQSELVCSLALLVSSLFGIDSLWIFIWGNKRC